MNPEKFAKGIVCVWIVMTLGWFAAIAGIIYVACHFIHKYWN
jgi:hypothetical protein